MSFRALGLSDRVLRAIQDAGYTEPTPIQVSAVPLILGGHDLIGIAQTGTGKTAAFTWPLLTRLSEPFEKLKAAPAPSAEMVSVSAESEAGPVRPAKPSRERRGIRALVLAPTRELVVQIEENVRAYARHLPTRLALVYGGVGEHPQIQALRHADIAIATPGRLLDLMSRGFADFSALHMLVLDEADRMLDMGFLPDIRRVVAALPHQRQTLLFSATLSRDIEDVTRQFLRSPKLVQIGRRANPAETVTQFVYEVGHHLKTTLLVHLLRDAALDMVLVFSRTKHGADRVARQLEQQGIRTATLHSNRSQAQRLRALKDFKSGAVRVLVATDIAARGIDVDGISHVVNYDFPLHAEDYVHRIGRTGRAHAVGDAISFVTQDDYGSLRSLERFIGRGLIRKRADNMAQLALPPAPSLSRQHTSEGAPNRHAGESQPRHNKFNAGERKRFEPRPPREHLSKGRARGDGQGHGPARAYSQAPTRGVERGQPSHRDVSQGGHSPKPQRTHQPQHSHGPRQHSNVQRRTHGKPSGPRQLSNDQSQTRDSRETRPHTGPGSSAQPPQQQQQRPWRRWKWKRQPR